MKQVLLSLIVSAFSLSLGAAAAQSVAPGDGQANGQAMYQRNGGNGSNNSHLLLEDDVRIFPNPTHGDVNIEIPKSIDAGNARVEVYNTLGKRVHTETYTISAKGKFHFNMGDRAPGIYFARLTIGDQQLVKRIVLK